VVEGCGAQALYGELCGRHYHRERRRAKGMRERPTSLGDHIVEKVLIDDGCWLWQGHLSNGYGRLQQSSRSYMAHRVVYEALVGPIPEGLVLDHLCREPRCVRPSHLEPVSDYENVVVRSSAAASALNARKTHCPTGHAYDEENTRVHRGKRYCRRCGAEQDRLARERRRLARSA